jgi:PKD domain-containing protein/type IX secretion system substrate protein
MNNMKIPFKLILPLLICILSVGEIANAQTINTESFDGTTFPPTDWSRTGGANSRWTRETTGNNPPVSPHSGAALAQFRVGGGPGSNGAQEVLISPIVNYIGASGSIPTVSLWMYRDGSSTAGDTLTIFVNTTQDVTGATRIGAVARSRFFVLPTNEPSDGWYQYTFNVPSSFNADTNYFLLRGTARGGGNIYIDDVQWDEYLLPCAGPITAGGVAADDSLLCGGSGIAKLSLTGSGLTGGGLLFQWQSGPSATGPWTDFGINAASVNSDTLTASTYFRCYVSCSGAGITDTSSTLLVDVSPDPAPVVTLNLGPNIDYCVGEPPLVFVASGAPVYQWSANITSNALGDTAIANPIGSSTYTVTGTDSSGCSGSTSVNVTVGSAPTVTATTSADTICSGQQVDLEATFQGPAFAAQIEWLPGGMTTQTVTVSPTVTTAYIVTVSFNFFFDCPGIDTVIVNVIPSPVAGFTFSPNNLTVTFTDTSSSPGTLTYLWDFGDGTTDTTQNPVHTYANSGVYTVTLTVSDGQCTNTFTQVLGFVGLEHLSDGSAINLYPNPVRGLATIEFSSTEKYMEMVVLNSIGKIVMNDMVYPSNGNLYRSNIDLSNLQSGIYFLQLRSKNENVTLKLIKQ